MMVDFNVADIYFCKPLQGYPNGVNPFMEF